jgi:hypothetical protein
MIHPHADNLAQDADEKPLDLAQARLVARMRRFMLVSGFATVLGVAVVIGVIGYRVFRAEGRVAAADVVAKLPQGARVIATAVSGDRIIVTLEVGGATELMSFDTLTLQPAGRLRFVTAP